MVVKLRLKWDVKHDDCVQNICASVTTHEEELPILNQIYLYIRTPFPLTGRSSFLVLWWYNSVYILPMSSLGLERHPCRTKKTWMIPAKKQNSAEKYHNQEN